MVLAAGKFNGTAPASSEGHLALQCGETEWA
jgi:hypothetical protein